jgi:IstB-like ATP binding protein
MDSRALSTTAAHLHVNGDANSLAREPKAQVIAATVTGPADRAPEGSQPCKEDLAAALATAHLPPMWTLEVLTVAHLPTAPRKLTPSLAHTTFGAHNEKVLLLRPPGAGKANLAIAWVICSAEAT